jgi:hypothetical protein
MPGGTGSPPPPDGRDEGTPELPTPPLAAPDGTAGTGMPAVGGGGVTPPAPLPRRAFRSIFGFFSSALEPHEP